MIYFNGNNIEDSDKQDIFPNTQFKAIIPSIKKSFFHQRMMNFVNKLELSDQKYQTNGNVNEGNYKGKFMIKKSVPDAPKLYLYRKISVLVCSVNFFLQFSSLVIKCC